MAGMAHRSKTNGNGDVTDWYVRGFMAKCAEAGVDPRRLLEKVAQYSSGYEDYGEEKRAIAGAAGSAANVDYKALQKQWMLENGVDTDEWRDAGSNVRKEMLDRIGGVDAFNEWLNRPRQPAPAPSATAAPASANAAGRTAPASAPVPRPVNAASRPNTATGGTWGSNLLPDTSKDWNLQRDPATGAITRPEPFDPNRPNVPAAPASPSAVASAPAPDPFSARFDALSPKAQSSALRNSGWTAESPVDAAAKQRAMEAYDAKVRQNAEERASYNRQHTGIYQTTKVQQPDGTTRVQNREVPRSHIGASSRAAAMGFDPANSHKLPAQSPENIARGRAASRQNAAEQARRRAMARPRMVTRGDVEKERARRDWMNTGSNESAWRYHQVPVYRPYAW